MSEQPSKEELRAFKAQMQEIQGQLIQLKADLEEHKLLAKQSTQHSDFHLAQARLLETLIPQYQRQVERAAAAFEGYAENLNDSTRFSLELALRIVGQDI